MNNSTSLKKGDCETFSFFVPHSLDSKIREYLVKNSYESLAEFIRQAIDEQLILESFLKLPLPKNRQKMLCFCVSPTMRDLIEFNVFDAFGNAVNKLDMLDCKFTVDEHVTEIS